MKNSSKIILNKNLSILTSTNSHTNKILDFQNTKPSMFRKLIHITTQNSKFSLNKNILKENLKNNHINKLTVRGIKYANENLNQPEKLKDDDSNNSKSQKKSNNLDNTQNEEMKSSKSKDQSKINNDLSVKSHNYHDIAEEDEIIFKNNPYLNKKDLIQTDKKEKDRQNQSVNRYLIQKIDQDKIEGLEINEVLDLIAKMLKAENNNPDLWYKLLNQFNELLCSHRVSKKDILNFLELINYFKPKILEKKILPNEITQIGSKIAFSKRHEEEYYRLTQPKDIFGQFALHLKKNLNANVISKIFDMKPKFENRENIEENFDDLLGLYSTLFKNIEQKIVDDIAVGRTTYSHDECVTLIKSFACAQEGTNMFYELLMRKIIKHFQELTLQDLEIVLNYLPHELYNNKEFHLENSTGSGNTEEKYVEMGRTKSVSEFYANVYEKVLENLASADNQLFLNLFQGCLRIKFVDVDVIGAFLLEFDHRLADSIQVKTAEDESKMRNEKSSNSKGFVLNFLQILTYFIRNDVEEKFVELIDFDILWKSIYENFLVKNFDNFTLKEISTIFWVMYHFRSVGSDKITFFEPAIKRILLGYINDPKSKIDTMGYETHLRYYDNYNIDPYDVEALKFFIESNKAYKGELISLIQKALKCINLENTHPISRGLFSF